MKTDQEQTECEAAGSREKATEGHLEGGEGRAKRQGGAGQPVDPLQTSLDNGQVTEMDTLSDSDCASSIADRGSNTDLHSLQEINDFLSDTFGKVVDVTDYFTDVAKFIRSVNTLQRVVGEDLLDKMKTYHLQKHST